MRLTILSLALIGTKAVAQQDFDAVEVNVLPVQGNVYMIVGAGGNIAMQLGDEGVVLVDTQFAQVSERVLAAIRAMTSKPILAVINTHVHPDHVGGNAFFVANSGRNVTMGFPRTVGSELPTMPIHAHENVLLRASAEQIPENQWPTNTYFTQDKELYMNGEGLRLIHVPAAHTDGDTIVHFRGSDVIAAGDVYSNMGFPVIDRARGGSIDGIIEGLGRLLHMIISRGYNQGGTYVVPGHGRIADEADVVEYRDMVVIIRDRIQRMVDDGMSLRQVLAAEPTLDYDRRYGSVFWTTEQFVEAVYLDLGGE